MPVRIVQAHPLVEEARNHVAVLRGPVVYCLESVDLPDGVKVLDVHLPPDAKLTPRPAKDLPAGIVALEGQAVAIAQPQWSDGDLYRDVAPPQRRNIDVRLVPYFAWDNRRAGEMTVWLPALL